MSKKKTEHRLLDLSGTIDNGMWDYSSLDLGTVKLPPIRITRLANIDPNGFRLSAFELTGLSGCYVETAGHMNPKAPLLDAFEVNAFMKPAKVMRLPPAEPYTLLTVDDFRKHDPDIEPGDALIIETGWSRHWNQPDYITAATAWSIDTLDWLVQQQFSLLATDTPAVECSWWDKVDPPHEKERDAGLLGKLYEALPDILLAGPLVNTSAIRDLQQGTLIAMPIKIAGVCAAPARICYLEGIRISG